MAYGINSDINFVKREDLCTGCGTCVGLCPASAIEMVIDHKKGINIPVINGERCTECGICVKVCPGHKVDFKDLNREIFGRQPDDILLGNYLHCYTGYATDNDLRYNSSSGGLVTALLLFALEHGMINGALVTRMKKDKPLEPEPFIARTREEIIEASKSKYCPIPANTALKEIIEAKDDEKYAVVGLPCHIHGLSKAENLNNKLKRKIVLKLGIFCSCTCNFMGTEFLISRLGLDINEIKRIDYRGEGWPGSMSIHAKDRVIKLPLSRFWDARFTAFSLSRCAFCTDATAEFADISLADAWGLADDNIGTSLIITRTSMGEQLLQGMLEEHRIDLSGLEPKRIAQTQKAVIRKKSIRTQYLLAKILRKKFPVYNQDYIKPSVTAYLAAAWMQLRMFLASHRSLWGVLDLSVRMVDSVVKKLKFIR